MKYIVVDVDLQNCFGAKEGELSVYKEGVTDKILDNAISIIRKAGETLTPVIGSVDSHSFDAWEFAENGGPFPAHAVKGTWGWLKLPGTLPKRFRFIPMTEGAPQIGEIKPGTGNRTYDMGSFGDEALKGVGLYFEKEVYSFFANPNASKYIWSLVSRLKSDGDDVTFLVIGMCTGGFCVDAAALKLREHGYNVAVVSDATQAIDGVNGPDGSEYSFNIFREKGIDVIDTVMALSYLR